LTTLLKAKGTLQGRERRRVNAFLRGATGKGRARFLGGGGQGLALHSGAAEKISGEGGDRLKKRCKSSNPGPLVQKKTGREAGKRPKRAARSSPEPSTPRKRITIFRKSKRPHSFWGQNLYQQTSIKREFNLGQLTCRQRGKTKGNIRREQRRFNQKGEE